MQRECDQIKSHFEMGKVQYLQLQQQVLELRSKAETDVFHLQNQIASLTQLNELSIQNIADLTEDNSTATQLLYNV